MVNEDPRAALDRLIAENGDDYASLSKLVGRNTAYIQQFIKRGSPKRLPEKERGILARYFGVDERVLGGLASPATKLGLRTIPKLDVGASAGPGAMNDAEALAGKIGFDEKWLRKLGVDPAHLSLIRVDGDSMAPTLANGDDIMGRQQRRDRRAARRRPCHPNGRCTDGQTAGQRASGTAVGAVRQPGLSRLARCRRGGRGGNWQSGLGGATVVGLQAHKQAATWVACPTSRQAPTSRRR